MKVTARVLTSVLIFLVSGCASRPVFSVEVLKTATPSAMDATEPLATSGPQPTLTFTPDTPESINGGMPADFSPVLYGQKFYANTFFVLLGAVQGESWLMPEQAAIYLGGEAEYDVHTLPGGLYQVGGSVPQFSPVSRNYSILTESTLDEPGMVGVIKGWPVQRRDVQVLSPDQDIYRLVVQGWLKIQGLKAPQDGDLHIFRVDLEGDGVDEVFISATHLDESRHTTKSGDYSVVLMRRVIGNEAVTVFIQGDVYHSQEPEITYPRTYSFGNFLDLDHDGVLEVIVEFHAWEDFGALLYQIDGQTITQVP
jgi:hypothetical protein